MRRCCACAIAGLALVAVSAGAADRGADGKYEKRTSSHFVLYQDVDIDRSSGLRGSRNFEQRVLEILESAYDRLDALLGLRPSAPIPVVVHDPRVFDQRFAGAFKFPAAGFYGGQVHIRGDVVVQPRLVQTLHHELVHAALHAEARNLALPAWLNEGLAEWFEARAAGKRALNAAEFQYLAAVADQGGLFRLADLSSPSFAHFGPDAAQLAYLESYGFVAYLARRHGERALRTFTRDLVRTGRLERSFRRAFREDLAAGEAGFVSEIARAGGR